MTSANMIKAISSFIVRRRRLFQFKLVIILIFVVVLLYWGTQHRSEFHSSSLPFSERFRALNSKDPVHNYEEGSIGKKNLLIKREKIREENTDPFLLPVLRDYKFSEVNLFKTRQIKFSDYDDEIVDDAGNVNSMLGKGGLAAEVPNFQKSVAEAIMKKEAFNKLLSDMIALNRSVPDTREAA